MKVVLVILASAGVLAAGPVLCITSIALHRLAEAVGALR